MRKLLVTVVCLSTILSVTIMILMIGACGQSKEEQIVIKKIKGHCSEKLFPEKIELTVSEHKIVEKCFDDQTESLKKLNRALEAIKEFDDGPNKLLWLELLVKCHEKYMYGDPGDQLIDYSDALKCFKSGMDEMEKIVDEAIQKRKNENGV